MTVAPPFLPGQRRCVAPQRRIKYDWYTIHPFGDRGVYVELWTGIRWSRLRGYPEVSDLPSLREPDSAFWLLRINYGPPGGFNPTVNGRAYRDRFAARLTGQLQSYAPGWVIFITCSDDGSRLYVEKSLVVDNDYLHGDRCRGGARWLEGRPWGPKAVDYEVQFWENWGGSTLRAYWFPLHRRGGQAGWLDSRQIVPSPPPSSPPPPHPPPPPPPPLPVWWPLNDVEKMLVQTNVVHEVAGKLEAQTEQLVEQLQTPTDNEKYAGGRQGGALDGSTDKGGALLQTWEQAAGEATGEAAEADQPSQRAAAAATGSESDDDDDDDDDDDGFGADFAPFGEYHARGGARGLAGTEHDSDARVGVGVGVGVGVDVGVGVGVGPSRLMTLSGDVVTDSATIREVAASMEQAIRDAHARGQMSAAEMEGGLRSLPSMTAEAAPARVGQSSRGDANALTMRLWTTEEDTAFATAATSVAAMLQNLTRAQQTATAATAAAASAAAAITTPPTPSVVDLQSFGSPSEAASAAASATALSEAESAAATALLQLSTAAAAAATVTSTSSRWWKSTRWAAWFPWLGGGARALQEKDRCAPEGAGCREDDLKALWPEERVEETPGPRRIGECDAGAVCGLCLVAIPRARCDSVELPRSYGGSRFNIRTCSGAVELGGFCEGDGECGTNQHHNQCGPGGWDIYEHVSYEPPDHQVTWLQLHLYSMLSQVDKTLRLARRARQLAAELVRDAGADMMPRSDYDLALAGDAYSAVEVAGLPPMRRLSIAMWVRSGSNARPSTIFSFGNVEAPAWMCLSNPHALFVEIGGRRQHSAPAVQLREREWHHVALTWRSEHGAWALYVDGAQVMGGAAAAHQLSPPSSRLTLGQHVHRDGGGMRRHTPGWSFQGRLSNANVFRSQLTAAQVALSMRFVPLTIPYLVRAWHEFRDFQMGSGATEVVPSEAMRAVSPPPSASNNFDARFKAEDADGKAGAMVVLGIPPLREWTLCAWLKCATTEALADRDKEKRDKVGDASARTAVSYATMFADHTLHVQSNFDFVLHNRQHLLRGAPRCDAWRHWCLVYEASGRYTATIDGVAYKQAVDHFQRGLPPGGALVVGQHQRRLGEPFESSRAFVGEIHAVGLWKTALGFAPMLPTSAGATPSSHAWSQESKSRYSVDDARRSQTRGALHEWSKFRAGVVGSVVIVEPSQAREERTPPPAAPESRYLKWPEGGFDRGASAGPAEPDPQREEGHEQQYQQQKQQQKQQPDGETGHFTQLVWAKSLRL